MSNLTAIARRYVTATKAADNAHVRAARIVVEYVGAGGKSSDLTTKYGVAKSTVSKSLALGKALALVPDADDQTVAAIKATLNNDQGDRAALVQATKDEDAAGVVAASKATPPKADTGTKDKGDKPRTVAVDKMTTDALVELLQTVLDEAVKRDDMPGKNADALVKFAKRAATLADIASKRPVTV